MKTIKNTNSFYVLGVKFENVQEAIEYAINEMDKNWVVHQNYHYWLKPSWVAALLSYHKSCP